jgi:hypothetical protein
MNKRLEKFGNIFGGIQNLGMRIKMRRKMFFIGQEVAGNRKK